MKPVLIVENTNKSLVRESNSSSDEIILNGVFTEFGIKNRNDRIYTADKFLPCLQEMNERISTMGVVYGEFDHPDVFDTSLSRASHLIRKAEYVKEGNRVDGEIKLLSTYWGKEARSLVNDGCPIFVSSRAAGVTESDGTVTLKKLFTYDIVADPGFASAKMNIKVLNESLGYETEKSNFRIYDVSDESKINELFNMNTNDLVTKKQLTDYSKYLVNELASTKKEVRAALAKGNMNPKKLEKLVEYQDQLSNTSEKIVKYLDYLAEKIQIVVNENTSLKTTTDKLIKHNDYLAENLEKAINYGEYLAENLDKNIAYSEYIAENLDKNISYSEYLAENLDSSIEYSEYLAEHVEGNIAYSEYIAENLDDNIAYSEYVAESLDKSISYQGLISERLNSSGKLLENFDDNGRFPSPTDAGFEVYDDENKINVDDEIDLIDNENELESDLELDPTVDSNLDGSEEIDGSLEEAPDGEQNDELPQDSGMTEEEEVYENNGDSDTELSKSIDKLIEEAKKRKVTETSDRHFLKFLNKSQVDSFYSLNEEEQEAVTLYISERSYFNTKDVLKLITEALSTKNETLEERVIKLMPESVKPIWNQLNENSRKSILSQARLYPEESLMSEAQIDHFWMTRNLKKNESVTKKLISHESLIQEDRVSDDDVKAIMERFRNL